MRFCLLILMFFYLPNCFSQGIINDGGLIVIGSGGNLFISNSGNYLNQSNGFNHGSVDIDGNIYLTGNWTNNASSGNVFVNIEGAPNGTVHLNGSSQQTLGGSAATSFEHLTISNNSVGNAVLLTQTQNVKGMLTFTDGIIGTGTNKMIIENTSTSSITGHDVDKYINGNLKRYLLAGAYDLPVGTLANYELVTTNITTLGSLNFVDAFFTSALPGAVPAGLSVDGTLISAFLDYGYWTLVPDDGSSTVMDVTAVSRGHSNGASSATQHALFKRTGAGGWENFGTHTNSTQSGTLTSPVTAKRTAYSNVLSNDYAIGRSDANVLPIELLFFTATCGKDSGVVINWATSSESNNDYFTIYRSHDRIAWDEIARVAGAGNSNSVQEYSFIDEKPELHDTYYKLRQTDFDGKYKEFTLVNVYCKFNHKKFVLYPNPAKEYIILDFYNEHHIKDKLSFNVYNSLGILCFSTSDLSDVNENSHRIELDNKLVSGNYFLQVKLGNEFFYTGQFNIQRN